MKKTALLLFLFLMILFACKEEPKTKVLSKETTQNQMGAKTYAEISIKEGGQWEGKKYVGEAFTFKNVEFLKAPDSLTDHSYYVRYEGPGWESNEVGYRLYLDWRNAIDSTTARIMNTEEGSGVVVDYYGWTVMDNTMDLKAELFIEPDSRMTKATLTPSKSTLGLSTGIVKFKDIDLVKKESENGKWGYIATYGEQTLVPDQLGMGKGKGRFEK